MIREQQEEGQIKIVQEFTKSIKNEMKTQTDLALLKFTVDLETLQRQVKDFNYKDNMLECKIENTNKVLINFMI